MGSASPAGFAVSFLSSFFGSWNLLSSAVPQSEVQELTLKICGLLLVEIQRALPSLVEPKFTTCLALSHFGGHTGVARPGHSDEVSQTCR